MPFTPFVQPAALGLVAATPVAGVPLVNGTPTLLSWTAPNDGQLHRVSLFFDLNVTVLEVGGTLVWAYTNPAGVSQTITIFAAGQAVGAKRNFDGAVVGAGTTVTVSQSTALTGGAAAVYAELWGS